MEFFDNDHISKKCERSLIRGEMGKLRIYGRLFVIVLLAAVLPACSGVKVVTSTVTQPVITGPADSVDIIYFHNTVE